MTHPHLPAPSAGLDSAASPGAAAPLVKPPPAPGPDASWLQWIADNLLRGCTPESMLETMATHGLDPARCEAALRDMDRNPANDPYLWGYGARNIVGMITKRLAEQRELMGIKVKGRKHG